MVFSLVDFMSHNKYSVQSTFVSIVTKSLSFQLFYSCEMFVFLHRRWVSTAATLPQLCLDYRKCKIAFVYSHTELKAGGGLKSAAASEDGRELERLQRAGRIWERVCLQAASEARPRMCCKSVVKQIGLFLLFASHDICFSLSPLPLLRPPLVSLWMDCLTHMLPFCGTVHCVVAAGEEGREAGRNRNISWVYS